MATFFIVEDEPVLLEIYTNILELKGHEVVGRASDGFECINKLSELIGDKPSESTTPDFILMDHRMPVKNGLETMKELLTTNPDLKIIFISADITIRNEALSNGAVDFISKPFNMSTLFESIDYLIK
jgi:two-component system chemotaxis response regulator CheY